MASPSSMSVNLLLRLVRLLRPLTPAKTMQAAVDRAAKKPADPAPRLVGKKVTVTKTSVNGMDCYDLTPPNPSGVHLLYLHGGSYTFEISPIQYWGISRLARASNASFSVAIYPLAPSSTADKTVERVTTLAIELMATYPKLIVIGDSAGGGLALAVGQQLVAAGHAPSRLILISPWLDVTMTNPALDEFLRVDLMLTTADLRVAGAMYAGALDPADPLASPINGVMAGLPPISLYCGTHDMLVADARALVKRAAAAGVPVDYYEQPGGQHVYPLLPTREGRAALAQLAGTLRG